MTTKTRTPAAILEDAREAQAAADDLETKAAAALDEARQIDADSVDLIVDDPAEAERITREVSTRERLANAYRVKARAERTRRDGLILDALTAETARLDLQAEKAEKAATAHQARVDELLAQLEDLDGVSYQVAPTRKDMAGNPIEWPETKGDDLRQDGRRLHYQAAVLRYYLEHKTIPETTLVLDWRDPDGAAHALNPSTAGPYFVAPMLAAHLAGAALSYTPED